MDADDIKQIADKCGQIKDFVRIVDSYGNTEITAIGFCSDPSAILCPGLTRKIWPDFRKQLIALYNELAATINADKFYDPDADDDKKEFTADDAYHSLTGE